MHHALDYTFDELPLLCERGTQANEKSRIGLFANGHASIHFDADGAWRIGSVAIDAFVDGREVRKADPIVITERTSDGRPSIWWDTLTSALLIRRKEEIQDAVWAELREVRADASRASIVPVRRQLATSRDTGRAA